MLQRNHVPLWILGIIVSMVFFMGPGGCPQKCVDNDGDGYGNPASTLCSAPEKDCNDKAFDANPGNFEGPVGSDTCSDGLDNDCDGKVDSLDPDCGPSGAYTFQAVSEGGRWIMFWQLSNSGQLVWSSRSEFNAPGDTEEIFYFDGVSTRQITDNHIMDTLPALNDQGQFVWTSDDATMQSNGVTSWIAWDDGGKAGQWPLISNEGYLAWAINSPLPGSAKRIYRKHGDEELIITEMSTGYYVMNSSGQIAWYGYGDSQYQIFFFDGSINTQLSNLPSGQGMGIGTMSVNDHGVVVWNEYADGGLHAIYRYDGSTKETIVADPASGFYLPQVTNEGHVAWIGASSGGAAIYILDGETTMMVPGSESASPVHFDMNNHGEIVWLELVDGSGPNRTYYFNGSDTIKLPDAICWTPYINDEGQIAWLEPTGSGYRKNQLHLATPIGR